MDHLKSINDAFEKRIHQYTAYVMTLYYFEIIYLMFKILFLYGKAAAVLTGSALSLALAYHIIRIFFKSGLHRKIQLYIIDLHAAYVIGFLFASSAAGADWGTTGSAITVIRSLTLLLELPLIYFLTKDTVSAEFR
jgi:hypothetical protein